MELQPLTQEQRAVVRTILGHIEQNCTEVEQVEEYLWQLYDKGTDQE